MAVTEKDLFLAILSMDSYNRGAGAGINDGGASDTDGLGEAGKQIGTATLLNVPLPQGSEAAGLYAVAYDTQYGKVISYRGTDFAPAGDRTADATRGWPLGGGDYFTPQTALSIDFLDAVHASAPRCCG